MKKVPSKKKKTTKNNVVKNKVTNKPKTPSKKKKKTNRHWLLTLLFGFGIIGALIIIAFAIYIIFTAPDFDTTLLYDKESTIIYDKSGAELAIIGTINQDKNEKENRIKVTYDDLPQVLIDALIATEDSRFFQHNGFDAARFFVASINQLLGKNAGGASTLTMQLNKNTYTDNTISIVRKFTDIYMAVFKIEKAYTKEEIIEFYFNSQWLGGGNLYYTGVYGVEQACQTYFGKSVNDISLPEASLLVGMFNNPSYFNPVTNPENAKERQKTVLSLMVHHGYITEEEAKAAGDIPIESLLKSKTETNANKTVSGDQAFIEYVLKEVKEVTGEDPYTTPMAIYTTLDRNIQNVLNDFENGNSSYKFINDTVQNGIAVTSVKDGSIVGMAPGRNYVPTGTNRAITKQQPGSTAKPVFDYGPLIEFNNASPGTLFFDEPYTYSNGVTITNYDNAYKGLIDMRAALIDSRNIPALQAFQQVSKSNIASFASSLGINVTASDLNEADSIGGSTMVSPLQMSAAYAAFARGGYYIAPYSFTKIVYLENEKEFNYKYTKTRVMSEETAYMINDMLADAGASNVGGNFRISNTDVAAKGGTTTIGSAEAKQIGVPTYTTPSHWNNVYTTDYSISLWYGYDILTPNNYVTSNQGSTARKGIMNAIAPKILQPNARFERPSGIVEATLEFGTIPLQLASDYTPSSLRYTEIFKRGTEPTEVSTRFTKLERPTNGNYINNGTIINLSWKGIPTPNAIDYDFLQTYFNENYKNWSNKYYQQRLSYNSSNLGTLGYQIYLDEGGNLKSLGFTPNTSYSYMAPSNGTFKFVIKSCYSIFKSNMSDGLTITVKLNNATTSTTPEPEEEDTEDLPT